MRGGMIGALVLLVLGSLAYWYGYKADIMPMWDLAGEVVGASLAFLGGYIVREMMP